MTKYRVTGPVPYAGHQPGEEFEAELPEDVERRALERGSLEVAGRKKKKTENEEEETDA